MTDSLIYVITALLPLSALILVVQVNPYNALVIRGILGAVAAMVYAVLGAADVALTEALMGTMLAITLYAVAVRSSLIMRLGVLAKELQRVEDELETGQKFESETALEPLLAHLRQILSKYYLRLELVPYGDPEMLESALMRKEVHGITQCLGTSSALEGGSDENDKPSYQTVIRVQRLYDILESELPSPATLLKYVKPPESQEKHG